MGLIKTGLALAGSYGLIKAASKAANDYEDKKLKRNGQAQYSHNYDTQANHGPAMNGPAMNDPGYYQHQGYGVARDLPFEGNSHYLNQQHAHGPNMSALPPSYSQGNYYDMQGNSGSGPTQHYQQHYPSDSKR
ncbi:uncharacterized protein N7511_010024 [Penicillium nucicola]|uniref:uncharacterized protein n=1 Tax=Penicillium nucicola TaxID=1850975 RepID=UPI002545AF74|nr:uncharacterized protein N7511_010024 [Penicillium nucicola]KAJ5748328.1 hypothetical protein N7511_010024 [Penicillium nucicola]